MKAIPTVEAITLALSFILCATTNAAETKLQEPEAVASNTASSNKVTDTNADTYGIDMSFPITGLQNIVSTNYPWLPHHNNNVNNNNNVIETPKQYIDMPIQTMGDRRQVYIDYLKGCKDYWNEYDTKERNADAHDADGENNDEGQNNDDIFDSENDDDDDDDDDYYDEEPKKLDVSIKSDKPKKVERKLSMEGTRACNDFEKDRFEQNIEQPISMNNFTDLGYKKIKAPEHVFKMISDFWEANKDKESDEEWGFGNSFVNYWDNPSKMISVSNTKLEGGGRNLHDSIWNVTSDLISEWTGQKLQGSSVYGIRVYKEGAMLAPHVDRLPLISSAIINVAQDLDEEWPLEVYGHDGVARNVTMKPGDMVLYESHSVIHGRPFALKGRYFANIFIHFQPIPSEEQIKKGALPPYIGEGTEIAKQWRQGRFEGDIDGAPRKRRIDYGQTEAHDAAGDGDLEALLRIAKEDEHALHMKDRNGWQPIHEAVRHGDKHVIEFLKEQGADLNSQTMRGGPTVLDIALDSEDTGYIRWIKSLGATMSRYELGPDL